MPEEINRILTDQLADLLLTPSADADRNLLAEGIPAERIRLVGNVMIDSLFKHLALSRRSRAREELGVSGGEYAVVTLHRPSNVDDAGVLRGIVNALAEISARLPVVFPAHPRTRNRLSEFGLLEAFRRAPGLRLVEPLGYLDFLRLYSGAALMLTDSGGVQEETTALGIPCLTLRENTERPVTVEAGTNKVVGRDPSRILREADAALARRRDGSPPRVPPLWDGKAADRILDALLESQKAKGKREGGGA
jgi:UDP-N-acetylglucosamine 2-epimerase (non-hydrolysing)